METESWRVEVDDRYFEDFIVLCGTELEDIHRIVLEYAEENLGGKVATSYLNTDTNVIKLWMHLWSNT